MAIPIQMKFLHNERRLYESRSRWGVVQVYEKRDRRELRFGNNVVQSAQSLAAPHTLLFEYIRAMMSGLLVCPNARHMLHLGLGAGIIPNTDLIYTATEIFTKCSELTPYAEWGSGWIGNSRSFCRCLVSIQIK